MLSAMTPTIIEKTIIIYDCWNPEAQLIASVLQTILNVYEYDMDIQTAVAAPRFHHQWLPDIITFEPNKFKRFI